MGEVVTRDSLEDKYSEVALVVNGIEFTVENMESMLINAWEGGSAYWIELATINHPFWENNKAYDVGWATSEFAFHAVSVGGFVKFDTEDDETSGKLLTLGVMKQGLEKWHNKIKSGRNYNDYFPHVCIACICSVSWCMASLM